MNMTRAEQLPTYFHPPEKKILLEYHIHNIV